MEAIISRVNDATPDEVWNVFAIEKVLDPDFKKSGKKKKWRISDDEKKSQGRLQEK